MSTQTVTVRIGEQIKTRRKELGYSLRDVAAQVSLTASFLSKIERNEASPSLDSLQQISAALDVPLFYFLLDNDRQKDPVVRRHARRKIQPADFAGVYELLTPDVDKKMEGVLTELQPECGRVPIRRYEHTEELIFVLAGRLQVGLGSDTYTLDAGDSIYFNGPMLQFLQPWGETAVRYISVVTPPAF